MKLLGFLGMLSIMLFMLGLAVYCLIAAGSDADDEMLGDLQYLSKEELEARFNDNNLGGKENE